MAMLCFVSPLACSLFAPRVGRLLDSVDRALGVASLLGLQCFSIIASGLILLLAFHYSLSITVAPIFHIVLLLSMMEKLAAVTSEVAIERDWVTQLCGKENNLALANSNSMLRKMDLACDFVGTVSFGWMYDAAGPLGSVVYTTLIAVASTPILYNLVYKIKSIAPESMNRKKTVEKNPRQSRQGSWRAYFRQPILPSSLVFVLLFFNVALSPGGILTAFLTSQGMNGSFLAIFRGSCAIMGFVGSWCGKFLIRNFGLIQSGRYALLMLLASLGTSLAIFVFSNLSSGAWPLILFTGGIVSSRIGLWSFDMVNAQLFQQNVDESETAATASTEMALCSFSEIFMLGVGASLSVPLESFYSVLVWGSFAAILLGTFVYFSWSARVTDCKGVILISH